MSVEIRGGVNLPAIREEIELLTDDGLTLVGELAMPLGSNPVATLVTLHPLPTAGGFMDSHILRKAAGRLPTLANIAVLRFNTRGTKPPLHRATAEEVAAWAGNSRELVALIPEHDDYLQAPEARERFSSVPHIDLIEVAGGKHLWVGESQTQRVLNEIVAKVNPAVALPLPELWDGDIAD